MKLLTYDTGTGPRCGVLQNEDVVDVSALIGDGRPLPDVRALLELGGSPIDRVRGALAGNVTAPRVPLADVRLRAPILQPPTVRDFIVYEEHASNQGTREPNEVWYRMPVFYFSNPLCIYGTDAQIPYPSASHSRQDLSRLTGTGACAVIPTVLPLVWGGIYPVENGRPKNEVTYL